MRVTGRIFCINIVKYLKRHLISIKIDDEENILKINLGDAKNFDIPKLIFAPAIDIECDDLERAKRQYVKGKIIDEQKYRIKSKRKVTFSDELDSKKCKIYIE